MSAAARLNGNGEGVSFDVRAVREQFPILRRTMRGQPMIYLDNAATTQKPQSVIDRINRYYAMENANVHRGVYQLSEEATDAYEGARETIRRFLNAASTKEIIFVRGTTEAINLVAGSFGRSELRRGDEIIISAMEHHSNIVPWQLVCEQTGAKLRVIPMNDRGELDLDAYRDLLGSRTRLVAVVHISNALGTVNPVREIIDTAHAKGVPVLVDGAQAVSHQRIDVRALDCDFYAFSGHKMFGPTGIGVLYGKEALLDKMPPYQGGGEMIQRVTFERSTYNVLPHKFEAGTPHISGVIGLGAAVEFLTGLDFASVAVHEQQLLQRAQELAKGIDQLRPIGEARDKASVFSFVIEDIHAHDVSTLLDQQGVAVRAGHHCAMPVMERMNVPATVRASFALYNTIEDVDKLFAALAEVRKFWA